MEEERDSIKDGDIVVLTQQHNNGRKHQRYLIRGPFRRVRFLPKRKTPILEPVPYVMETHSEHSKRYPEVGGTPCYRIATAGDPVDKVRTDVMPVLKCWFHTGVYCSYYKEVVGMCWKARVQWNAKKKVLCNITKYDGDCHMTAFGTIG
jgi:hypothetical protein